MFTIEINDFPLIFLIACIYEMSALIIVRVGVSLFPLRNLTTISYIVIYVMKFKLHEI